MKILILVDYFPPGHLGGVGEVAAGLFDAYRRLGHTVHVLTTGVDQPGERERGIYRTHEKLIPGLLLINVWAPRMIRELHIDLVHIQQSSSTLFLLPPFRRPSTRLLYTLHVSYADEAAQVRGYRLAGRRFWPSLREYLERGISMPVHRVLDGIGLRHADCITVMNRQNRDRISSRAPVHQIPNGFTPPPCLPDPPQDPALLSFVENRRVVAFSGSFRTRKRLPLMLLALQHLLTTHADVVLLVLGGGHGYELRMRELARSLQLDEHVRFIGHISQPEVLRHLRLTDIFCMVSTIEGMPVALMEAMALGIAVVGTKAPGTMDAIDDEETGLLVDLDDVEGLARALRRLLDDEQLMHRLGHNAARRVREKFSWNVIARQYLAAIEAGA